MADSVGGDPPGRVRTGVTTRDQRGYANVWDHQYAKWFLFGTNKHSSVYSRSVFGVPKPPFGTPIFRLCVSNLCTR
jgi:hypothetical protein